MRASVSGRVISWVMGAPPWSKRSRHHRTSGPGSGQEADVEHASGRFASATSGGSENFAPVPNARLCPMRSNASNSLAIQRSAASTLSMRGLGRPEKGAATCQPTAACTALFDAAMKVFTASSNTWSGFPTAIAMSTVALTATSTYFVHCCTLCDRPLIVFSNRK
jgi:hypothetical protein